MVSSLSQQDVRRLLADPSTDVRAEVAEKLAGEIDSPKLTEAEFQIAQDIVRLMARDASVAVRTALSQALRTAKRLPHDVAVKLAYDVEAVALPVIADSSVLTDADLIAIVRRGSSAQQEAVADRPEVSEAVSDALIEDAGESAVARLMRNVGARIRKLSFEKAADRFADSDMVKQGMAERSDLPATVAKRLVSIVSDQLANYLVARHELSRELAVDIIGQSSERAMEHMRSDASGVDFRERVHRAHEAQRANRLGPLLVLLRALSLDDMDYFASALAAMAKVPVANARTLIDASGENSLRSLSEKAGLPAKLLAAVRFALHTDARAGFAGSKSAWERHRAGVIGRTLGEIIELDRADCDYLCAELAKLCAPAEPGAAAV